MIDLICGILIGIVMGLTGAGGALVAIPLFMQFMGQSLKEASLYSLVAVVLASLFNFLAQRLYTQYKTAMIIVFSSAIGSYLTVPLKTFSSPIWIAIILAFVSVFALFNVWFPIKIKQEHIGKPLESFWVSVCVGLILGALTTLTGLGGGVLMLPVFLGIYRLSHSQAVATSLLAVGLSSLSSLSIQISKGAEFNFGVSFLYLLIGIFSAAFLLKKISHKIEIHLLMKLRQIVFSIVVFIALAKIFQ